MKISFLIILKRWIDKFLSWQSFLFPNFKQWNNKTINFKITIISNNYCKLLSNKICPRSHLEIVERKSRYNTNDHRSLHESCREMGKTLRVWNGNKSGSNNEYLPMPLWVLDPFTETGVANIGRDAYTRYSDERCYLQDNNENTSLRMRFIYVRLRWKPATEFTPARQ